MNEREMTQADGKLANTGEAGVPLLEMKKIVKRFSGVAALSEVDFDVCEGEVHALFGENGSGKSTIVKIITGVYSKTSGTLIYQGREKRRWTPNRARSAGISTVFQEFSLIPEMTVLQNLFLGCEMTSRGVLRKKKMRSLGRLVLDNLSFNLNLNSRVYQLSRADQQMTEIAKAVLQDVKLLILDEPTASLTEGETVKLFELIEELRKRKIGIIYVSHRLAEIRKLASRITVLRDGRKIDTVKSCDVTDNQLVEMMSGRKIDRLFPIVEHKPGAVILEMKNLSVEGRLKEVSLRLREGEITGIAGLAGSGKSEIARAVFGLEQISDGQLIYNGERISQPKPAAMLARGIFYVPSDRMAEGLALPRPVRENISVASLDLPAFSARGILRRRKERIEVNRTMERLPIRPRNIELAVHLLSGGNQQKVMLLRGLTRSPKVFLFDDPTVGIDVGAKRDVYFFLKAVAAEGAGVLFISSELPELLNLCSRVYVAHRGQIVAEFLGDEMTEQNVLRSFFEVGEVSSN